MCLLSLPCSQAQITSADNPPSALWCLLLPLSISSLMTCSWSSPDLASPHSHFFFPHFTIASFVPLTHSTLPSLGSILRSEYIPFSSLSPSVLQFCYIPSQKKPSILLYFNWIPCFQSWQLITPPLFHCFSHLFFFLLCFTLPNHTLLLLQRISPTYFELKLSGFSKLLPFQDFSSASAGHAGHIICNIHSKQTNIS